MIKKKRVRFSLGVCRQMFSTGRKEESMLEGVPVLG